VCAWGHDGLGWQQQQQQQQPRQQPPLPHHRACLTDTRAHTPGRAAIVCVAHACRANRQDLETELFSLKSKRIQLLEVIRHLEDEEMQLVSEVGVARGAGGRPGPAAAMLLSAMG
jgi:hypothetical protein